MAQKINPIIFRKNTQGDFFLNVKATTLSNLDLMYHINNSEMIQTFLINFFNFFNLELNYLLITETNGGNFFISIRYHCNFILSKHKPVHDHFKLFKYSIIKSLLNLIPAKNLILRLIDNRKIFFLKHKKQKLIRVLKKIVLSSCDPFTLVKTLRHSMFNSYFFAIVVSRELRLIQVKHNKLLILFGKLLKLCVNTKFVRSNLNGIQICIKGRFNGRLRAATKILKVGTLSLQKMLSIIDFCSTKSITSKGTFGIKIWFHY